MITVAFRADLTRVVTFLVTREGTSRAYREIGIADGHHPLTHHDLPTLIAGSGGGFIKSGRRVVSRKETPMCNLFLTMMDRMGTRMEQFGDSTGHLNGLDV